MNTHKSVDIGSQIVAPMCTTVQMLGIQRNGVHYQDPKHINNQQVEPNI